MMRRMIRGMMHGAAAHGVLLFKPGLQAQRLHHPVRDKNELLGGAGVQYAASDARQLRHLRLARQRLPRQCARNK